MNTWQDKLHTLIEAHKQGHPLLKYELYIGTPLEPKQVEAILYEFAQEFELEPKSLKSLRDLYRITDGVTISSICTIPGLTAGKIASRQTNDQWTLQNINRDDLPMVQERAQEIARDSSSAVSISLIFGLDDVGDCFCLTKDGSVVLVGLDAWQCNVVANSLDSFFDDVCMGSGYLHYYRLSADDQWAAVLREFGFIN